MPRLGTNFELDRCPYCHVDHPQFQLLSGTLRTTAHDGRNQRAWRLYACARCGGVVLAHTMNYSDSNSESKLKDTNAEGWIPNTQSISNEIPADPKHYLNEAITTQYSPSASVVMSAAAVDAMLKEKGYVKGSLNDRIDEAATKHLITADMSAWAHDIRLEANSVRHADKAAGRATQEDAQRCLEFALALAEFLFVLPARVSKGRKAAGTTSAES